MRDASLSREDLSAIREYFHFYEPRSIAINAGIRRVIVRLPIWKRLLEAVSPDELFAQDELVNTLLRAAIFEGAWEPYFSNLRARGAGYARTGVSYQSWFDMVTAYRDTVREHMTRFLQEDVPGNLRTATTISHGMNRLLDIVNENIGDSFLATTRELVARGEDRYRALFDNSPLPMWMFDRETLRFVAVNEAAVHHYGYTREEFGAMTLADIRPPEDVHALRADIDRAFGLGDATSWRHRKKDGSIITVEIKANDFVENGRAVRLVLVTDITERERAQAALKRTEDQLRHAQKMDAIGQLAGGVAHDFNNLLTVIVSYACMLEETDGGDTRQNDAAEIRRAAERAAVITRKLLTLSRHSIVAPRSISLSEVVAGLGTMLRRLAGERVVLAMQENDVPSVLADPGQIEQVVMNLVINARDAMPKGGRLTIETGAVEIGTEDAAIRRLPTGRYVVLAVADTGIGMTPETQSRIFDPFFTTKEVGKGTGLGLAIVHGIVSQANGSITVDSEVGRGTTVRLYFPITDQTVTAPQVQTTSAPRVLPPITALVVDDETEVRTVAARILQEAGAHVIEAATADEALRICVSHAGSIDLVLLDVVLTDGRGDQLIRQLRELRPTLNFVLMSGYPNGGLAPNGGAPTDLLAKPFSPSDLRAAVARAIGAAEVQGEGVKAEPVASFRVLVADDDPELLRVIGRILRRTGFEVIEVDSGAKAISALEAKPFDVIVSDVHMPEGGGLDLMRAVRRVDLDVPVILMSGAPDVATAAAAVEYGAFRYLTKPIDIEAFANTVQHANRAHALARLRREAFSVTGTHAGVTDRAGLEVRFEQAVDGIWMAFQPIVDAKSGALFGIEALMRSTEPSMPNPQVVLDAATQLGRLAQVGRHVRSLSATAFAQRTDDVALFVNLHPEDLLDIDLIDEKSPLTRIASRVILEITERSSLNSTPELSHRLARLRELGFRLAVDDIGAGYSGLTSFTELTPEVVKIDMSLVRDVHSSALKQRTISALCRLCHDVGCLVVAEGVETNDERECLVGLGCDLLQGYLLGRPGREPATS
ncbi:MAG: Blue-light-activated protein [Myxococcales bacterium]|nr:Blue-light-activated protein [Myxococcales bacterium]